MAFLIKNSNTVRTAGVAGTGQALVGQAIHVNRPALALPQTLTEQLFRVIGGKIRVLGLVGTVTTVIQSSDPVLKVSSEALDAAGALVGTVLDVASTVDISSLEVGGMVFVEGDGTAAVKSVAGAAFIGTNSGQWIAPQGAIYITTGASKTGAMKWDLWYMPLDEGAYATAVPVATAKV